VLKPKGAHRRTATSWESRDRAKTLRCPQITVGPKNPILSLNALYCPRKYTSCGGSPRSHGTSEPGIRVAEYCLVWDLTAARRPTALRGHAVGEVKRLPFEIRPNIRKVQCPLFPSWRAENKAADGETKESRSVPPRIAFIDLDLIHPNPAEPRKSLDEEIFAALKAEVGHLVQDARCAA